MSLGALIYSKITKVTSVYAMTQIMIVDIQLYSCLSLLARQSMSMLTELPGMVTVLEQFFHLEYSDSYTCNIHHYCTQLFRERLTEEMCTRQSRKVIWDMINTLFLTL